MTTVQNLIDEIRELQAQAAGKQIELCMLLHDREGAERAQREMFALIEARQAAAYANANPYCSADQAVPDLPALLRRQAA